MPRIYLTILFLLLLYILWIFFGPIELVRMVNAGLAGWFVGRKIVDIAHWLEGKD